MSGGRWNPWAAIRALPWVTVIYDDLPDACALVDVDTDGRYVITLANRLSRVARRCALAHELVHIDLDLIWPPDTAGHIIMRGELTVDRIVAERLVPELELRAFVRRNLDLDEMVLARDVADEFDVDIAVAGIALSRLEAKVRDASPLRRTA